MNAVAPAKLFEKLRAETCLKLDFDPAALKPWQEAKITTIALLLLEQDRQVSAALKGERVDPRDVSSIGEQLQTAYNPSRGGDSPEAHEIANANARETLLGLITRLQAADEFEARDQECDQMLKDEQMAIAATLTVAAPQPTLSGPDNVAPDPQPVRFVEHDTVTIIDGTCTEVTPPKPTKQSQTHAAFARHIEQQGNSLKQGDQWSPPPSGW